VTVVGHQLITLTSSFVQHDGRNAARRAGLSAAAEKGKERKSMYIAQFYIPCISQSAQAWITQFYLQIHACFSFVSVHQMAPPLTEVRDIQLQFTTYLSTPKG